MTKLNAAGTALVYSTYLGGSGGAVGYGIAVDGGGHAYVAGAAGVGFPTTAGAFQTTSLGPGAFVSELNASGTALVYSTYLGINGAKALGVALDSKGDAIAAGGASSRNPGSHNGVFVIELNPTGASASSEYLGGGPGDAAYGVAVDENGNAYVAGVTTGAVLTTAGAFQPTGAGGSYDAFVAKINFSASTTKFAVSGFPSPATAGVAATFTVTAETAAGSVITGYTGTVQFSSSDGLATLPANYTYTSADAGVHTFSATLKTAGPQSLFATDTVTASIAGSESGIVVKPGAASLLVVSAPSTVTHGVAFLLTLTVEDAYGNVVTGYTGTLHVSSSDSTATLPANYTFTTADAGRHTFTNKTTLKKKGKQTLTFTDTLKSALIADISVTVT